MTAGDAISRDEQARRRIATALDDTLFVEAGAGTGKTTCLVERLTGLLAVKGVPVDRVAAITFTRFAASELRSRVRQKLEQLATGGSTDAAAQRHVEDTLARLDEAAIQTIDSFALGILRDRPLEAGLPPALEPVDEIEAALRSEERWEQWLRGALDTPEFAAALSAAARLGLSQPIRKLRDVARTFHENYELLEGAIFVAPSAPERLAAREIVKSAPRLRELLQACVDREDGLRRHLEAFVLPLAQRLGEEGPESDEALAALAEIGRLAAPKTGRQKNWPAPKRQASPVPIPIKEVRDILDGLQQAVDRELGALRQAALLPMLAAVAKFVREHASERRRLGTVEFHDSLVWACALLRSDASALAHFRDRYQRVLIDEFQDTDPLQVELARLLTHRPGEARPVPGALFIVGDPKQSIYRFRRADIRAYRGLIAEAPDAVEYLTRNFRSHPAVLRWANHVFKAWMQETSGPDQAEYVELEGGVEAVPKIPSPFQGEGQGGGQANSTEAAAIFLGRPLAAPLAGPAPGVHHLGDELDVRNVDAVRPAEADSIARLALEIGAGAWRVRDGAGHPRPSTFGDLCVLMPSRNGLEYLERSLQEWGVPYTLEGQSMVFASQDVRDLLNCLTAIDDPTDQVAVVAALRSPAFGCSDVDLYDWAVAGGTFDYDLSPPQAAVTAAPRVAGAFETLRKFREQGVSASTPELIETFVRDRRLRELAVASRHRDDRLRRLQLVVELARQLHEAGHTSLRQFIRWAEERQESRARMAESALEMNGLDAVRVMTVHAAKGLEFPVVLLAGLTGRTHRPGPVIFGHALRPLKPVQGQDNAAVANGASGRRPEPVEGYRPVGVRIGTDGAYFETADYAALRDEDATADAAEDVRLMYVAATRAKDHLVVSVFRKAGDRKSRAAKLAAFSAEKPELWDEVAPPDSPSAPPQPAAPGLSEEPFDPESWESAWRMALAAAGRTGSVSATSLRRDAAASARPGPAASPERGVRTAAGPLPKEEAPESREDVWRPGRAATDFGRAVHAVLQTVDLLDPGDVAELARTHAARHGVSEMADEAARFASAVLTSPVMRRAAEAAVRGRCWREVWVAAPLPFVPSPLEGEGQGEDRTSVEQGVQTGSTHDAISSATLEGAIDLIFEDTDGGLVIVDYKTDQLSDAETLAEAAAPYEPQLGAYVWAVERTTGRKVTGAWLIFASRAARGRDAEYRLPDLARSAEDAAALAAQSAQA